MRTRSNSTTPSRKLLLRFFNHLFISFRSDPERRYFYGLSQSIELTCETLIARFRAEEQERKRRIQKAQVAQAAEAQAQAWAAAQARAQAGAQAPQASGAPLFAEVKAEPLDEGMVVKMEDIDEEAYDNTPMNNEQFLDFGMVGHPNLDSPFAHRVFAPHHSYYLNRWSENRDNFLKNSQMMQNLTKTNASSR